MPHFQTSPVPQRDDPVGETPVDAAVGAAVAVAAPSEGARQPEISDLQLPLLGEGAAGFEKTASTARPSERDSD